MEIFIYFAINYVFLKIMQRKKQLNIRLDEETRTKIKLIAILKNQTINDYIEDAIKKTLNKDKEIINKITKK